MVFFVGATGSGDDVGAGRMGRSGEWATTTTVAAVVAKLGIRRVLRHPEQRQGAVDQRKQRGNGERKEGRGRKGRICANENVDETRRMEEKKLKD